MDTTVDGSDDRAIYEALTRAGVPVLSVPGNHDGEDAYPRLVADQGSTDLHDRLTEHEGWWFAGFGLRAWDGTSDTAHETGLGVALARLQHVPPGRLVLLTHLPPRGTLAARDRRFVDRGSAVLTEWIASRQPAACVSGHVHHREVITERIGETLIVNPGSHGFLLTL